MYSTLWCIISCIDNVVNLEHIITYSSRPWIGAAAARAAKAAALFRSSLNTHNQFSQVSWLALAWPRVLYVHVCVERQ